MDHLNNEQKVLASKCVARYGAQLNIAAFYTLLGEKRQILHGKTAPLAYAPQEIRQIHERRQKIAASGIAV